MSEMGRDVARAAERAGEVAQQVLGVIDRAYINAKAADWGEFTSAALTILVLIVLWKLGWRLAEKIIEAKRVETENAAKIAAIGRPQFGSQDYLDWANREGRYASPVQNDKTRKFVPSSPPLPLP